MIGVIIPVYNVKNYLRRCVDSILTQTYNDLEIILIDDGSTDGSGEICDEYKKCDKRVTVIHKKNGGLSDSRNVGIEKCRAEYITFVDSDDWLPKCAIEKMCKAIQKNDVDIVSGDIKPVFSENIEDNSDLVEESKVEIFENENALFELMYMKKFSNSASGKIYKKSLFDKIKYPVGKLYEDLGTTYKVFAESKRIAYINEVVYYYYQRSDSIMHQKYTERRLDAIDFAKEELDFVEKKYSKVVNAAKYRLLYECISVMRTIPAGAKRRNEIKGMIKEYRPLFLGDKNLPIKRRAVVFSSYFGTFGIKTIFLMKKIFAKYVKGS